MTLFLITATLMMLAGLLFFLPALRDTQTKANTESRARLNLMLHEHRQNELQQEDASHETLASLAAESERNLLADLETGDIAPPKASTAGRTPLLASLGLLLFAIVGAYFILGRPDLADKEPSPNLADTREAVQRLAKHLSENPNDLESWVMLGQALQATQKPDQAVKAFEFAIKLAPENLDLQGFYAQSLAEANQGSMAGKPEEIALGILKHDPQHKNGLWLAGIAAAEKQDIQGARTYWGKLKAQFPEDSREAKDLADYMNRLPEPESRKPSQASGKNGQAHPASIHVTVTLANTLKSKATADDKVFIFVRAAEGPPMPLAVVRKQVKDLPTEVVLDDSMAMQPGMSISSFDKIVVGARISKQGQPTASPGDLQGFTAPMKPKQKSKASLEINQIVEDR